MKYWSGNNNLRDVLIHLRNKDLSFVGDNNRLVQRVLNRLRNLIDQLILVRRVYLNTLTRGKLVVSEQIIENPLVLRSLRETDKTILDFGGFESLLPLQLTALGYKVTVLDRKPYPFTHPELEVLSDDLFSERLKISEEFDVVISISTIEHLGLGRYGDVVVENGDMKGAQILWGLVKPGGRLMASVPAGKPVTQRGYRVYDEKRLRHVFPCISRIYWFSKNGPEGTWCAVGASEIEDLTYSRPYGQMPCEAVALVICDKPLA